MKDIIALRQKSQNILHEGLENYDVKFVLSKEVDTKGQENKG